VTKDKIFFNFFATELPKNLQTFLHSDNPEFLGSSFSLSRHRERERERERDREIIYQNLELYIFGK